MSIDDRAERRFSFKKKQFCRSTANIIYSVIHELPCNYCALKVLVFRMATSLKTTFLAVAVSNLLMSTSTIEYSYKCILSVGIALILVDTKLNSQVFTHDAGASGPPLSEHQISEA